MGANPIKVEANLEEFMKSYGHQPEGVRSLVIDGSSPENRQVSLAESSI